MLLFVPLSFALAQGATNWTVTVNTDLPGHLFLIWTLDEPYPEPRYRLRRGVLTECGVTWHWRNVSCTEQAEPGLTTAHTFVSPYPLMTPIPAWMTIADACDLDKPTSSTPPIPQILEPIVPTQPEITLTANGLFIVNVPSETAILWDSQAVLNGWPPQPLPQADLEIPAVASYQLTYTGRFRTLAPGTLTIRIRRNPGFVLVATAIHPIIPPGIVSLGISASPALTPADTIRITLQATAGATIIANPVGEPSMTLTATEL